MFEHSDKWDVTVKGFAGKEIYVGHGDDISGNDAKHRYGNLILATDEENFQIYGYSASYGDVCLKFPDGPLFIGNNPEVGDPSIEMHNGSNTDHRNIDYGVTTNWVVDGIKYSFTRPEKNDMPSDYQLMYVTISRA